MAKEKKEHVDFQRSYFDRNVQFFLNPIPEDVIERSKEIAALILRNPEQRILDVGTGCGAFLKHYHNQGVPYENMLGCDLSSQMLEQARRNYPEVKFWQGDVLDLPFDFGSFDLVVFNACFGNIIDQFSVLKNCAERLKEAGRIAISHPMGNSFVAELKAQEPELVCTLMPEREKLLDWGKKLSMKLICYRDEPKLFLAILEKEA
ncbi:MAG: class I SAM-dependent methyltransferase [Candidatus Obscuribacterales bacterium]|nr:class I SAM-dependent methyltransferase [Candidatus Obscuribacterales bacterium]